MELIEADALLELSLVMEEGTIAETFASGTVEFSGVKLSRISFKELGCFDSQFIVFLIELGFFSF